MKDSYGYIEGDNVSFNLPANTFLELASLDIHTLENKNIVDIGGGFGVLAPMLAEKAHSNITIIDPVFDENIDEKITNNKNRVEKNKKNLQENIERKHNLNNKANELLSLLNTEVFPGEKEFYATNDEANVYQEEASKININPIKLKANDELLNVLDNRKAGKYNNTIKKNASSIFDISGIEEDSQNIIFINHLLEKFKKERYNALKETNKILKEDGKIFIIDYVSTKSEIYNICKKKGIIMNEKGGSFCVELKKSEYKTLED